MTASRVSRGVALGLLFAAGPACAMAPVEWSGFASVGAGYTGNDHVTLMEYDGTISYDSDTMAGLQAIVHPADRFSLTTQIVARGYNFSDGSHYKPRVEWFFGSYEVTPDLRLRLGRLRTPHYLFSENLEVGYSYPWVRLPIDMYVPFLEPFSHFDGADITWQHPVAGDEVELKAYAGRMSSTFMDIDINALRTFGVTATLRHDEFTFHYGFNRNNVNVTLPGVDAAINGFRAAAQFDPQTFAGLDENFGDHHRNFDYHGIGVQWEHGDWSIIGERFAFRGPDSQWGFDANGWYLSISRQFGKFQPYFVDGLYETRVRQGIFDDINATFEKYPAGGTGLMAQLDALRFGSMQALAERNVGQHTWTVGVRYDFMPHADVKLEVQYFDFLKGSTGDMIPEPVSYRPSGALLTSLVFDVVF